MRAIILLALLATSACGEKVPDRLALDPAGPFQMQKKGQSETLQVAAFVGPRPYVKAVPAVWTTSDATVATVDETGRLVATGSGEATITATAWGLSAAAKVTVVVVGSVEVQNDVPNPLKLSAKPWPLKVIVKDDKGNVIAKPLVRYRALNYCVDVNDEGLLSPLAHGDCDVLIESADKSVTISIATRA